MQRYDVLLLDADGTLLDFHAAEKAAMRRCFISLGLPFDVTYYLLFHPATTFHALSSTYRSRM